MIYAPWLSKFNIGAITIWKWVFYAEKNPDKILINHERIHLDQIKRDGVFKFYFKYLADYMALRFSGKEHFEAYMNIPYEKEAYANQGNFQYEV